MTDDESVGRYRGLRDIGAKTEIGSEVLFSRNLGYLSLSGNERDHCRHYIS